jgi:beta-fructofuranosidase
MSFETLQNAFWRTKTPGEAELSLLTFGTYIELSVSGRIILSLADRRYTRGFTGIYLDTADLLVSDVCLNRMDNPEQYEDHLVGA